VIKEKREQSRECREMRRNTKEKMINRKKCRG
jgi:hypothetical protein